MEVKLEIAICCILDVFEGLRLEGLVVVGGGGILWVRVGG